MASDNEAIPPTANPSVEEPEVSRILDVHYKRNGERMFLVEWERRGPDNWSWELESHLTNTNIKNLRKLIKEFFDRNRNNNRKRAPRDKKMKPTARMSTGGPSRFLKK